MALSTLAIANSSYRNRGVMVPPQCRNTVLMHVGNVGVELVGPNHFKT